MTQDRVTADPDGAPGAGASIRSRGLCPCVPLVRGILPRPLDSLAGHERPVWHKYITPQEAAPYEVRIGGPGVLLFLEGLEDTP